jgi:hypothetical protein
MNDGLVDRRLHHPFILARELLLAPPVESSPSREYILSQSKYILSLSKEGADGERLLL